MYSKVQAQELLSPAESAAALFRSANASAFSQETRLPLSNVRFSCSQEVTLLQLRTAIDVDDGSQPWAAAGTSVTLNLVSIDPAQVNIGTVLCPVTDTIPLATIFSAKIIVFDIQVPITAGASVSPIIWSLSHQLLRHCRWSCFIIPGMCLQPYPNWSHPSTVQRGLSSKRIHGRKLWFANHVLVAQ